MAAVGKGSMLAEDDALPSDAEDDAEACGGPEVNSEPQPPHNLLARDHMLTAAAPGPVSVCNSACVHCCHHIGWCRAGGGGAGGAQHAVAGRRRQGSARRQQRPPPRPRSACPDWRRGLSRPGIIWRHNTPRSVLAYAAGSSTRGEQRGSNSQAAVPHADTSQQLSLPQFGGAGARAEAPTHSSWLAVLKNNHSPASVWHIRCCKS